MAFRDFVFPQVGEQLGVRVVDANLFGDVAPVAVRPESADLLRDGVELAIANSTEKATSEFIIAPVLLELWRSLRGQFTLFSGVERNVDAARGLNGYCDFVLGRGPSQHILQAPFIAVVEAKNDLIRTGLGQCVAAMVAARISNEWAGLPPSSIHGAVSTGASSQFLRLDGDLVRLDTTEVQIADLPRIMGILRAIVEVVPPAPRTSEVVGSDG